MQTFSNPHIAKNNTLLLWLLLSWLLLNLVQAAFIPIDADEAYYWLYAQHLQWGYFDHPPLVALSIRLGETLDHGAFYTRLGTALFSAGTFYFGFKLLPQSLQNLKNYLLVFLSVALFHAYGFIATPDASLLFFTTLFFYAYRQFLEKETATTILLLAFSITGLLYSKYHGVLPLFFTFLSNPKLFFKPAAWAVVVLVLLFFSPHLWWQYQHDWPTFRYHLFERISSRYKLSKTTDFIAGQLFIWGPFTTIPAFFFFFRSRQSYSVYERAHRFTFWGVLIFFLLSSFRSAIEPHWTLVAGPSFVVLVLRLLVHATAKQTKVFTLLFYSNIFCILLLRVLLVFPQSPLKNVQAFDALFFAKAWADRMKIEAAGRPVVFVDSYKFPALYQYYLAENPWDYNTVNYRKTDFNLRSDAFLNNQSVLLASKYPLSKKDNFFKTPYVNLYVQQLDSFKAVNALHLAWTNAEAYLKPTSTATFSLVLNNSGRDTITTDNLYISYTFIKTRMELSTLQKPMPFTEKYIVPGSSKLFQLPIMLPKEKGTYRLLFSIVQPPLSGSFASPVYSVTVD